jgi:hypothetical protein
MIIFLICLCVSLTLLLLIHALRIEEIVSDESRLFLSESVLYLTGLGTLFFGWRLIDHKFPSKQQKDES